MKKSAKSAFANLPADIRISMDNYFVARQANSADLSVSVSDYIRRGYVPQGGITVAPDGWLMQPMIARPPH